MQHSLMQYTGTMYLHCPWTASDLRDVMEGILNPICLEPRYWNWSNNIVLLQQKSRDLWSQRFSWNGLLYRETGLKKICHTTGHIWISGLDWTEHREAVTDLIERILQKEILRIHSGLTPPVDPTEWHPHEQPHGTCSTCRESGGKKWERRGGRGRRGCWLEGETTGREEGWAETHRCTHTKGWDTYTCIWWW